jgi:2,3-oxidosqualene cyclase
MASPDQLIEAATAPDILPPTEIDGAQSHNDAIGVQARHCAARALERLCRLQKEDGSFEGEVVWCPMILAQYVIVCRVLGRKFTSMERERIVLHFKITRRPAGGWGLHPESNAYVFVTALSYVALRLLGEDADVGYMRQAREWLHAQPTGVLGIPSWGKFWLSLIGLYEYSGMNPCPPELFLLPKWSPIHPDQLYCHTRYIYLGISFLYGARARADIGPIAQELRRELYAVPYGSIDFAAHRHDLAANDLYVAPSRGLRMAWDLMARYERLHERLAPLRALRRRALARCLQRIRFEQQASNYQGLSPVNGILNTVALWVHDPKDAMLAPSLEGIESWRWDDAHEGIRLAGARSTSWDTAFAMLAMLAGPQPAQWREALSRAYSFLAAAQEKGEIAGREPEARDAIRGGWCFSDGKHRWPVSDCAAEALSAILEMHAAGLIERQKRLPSAWLEAAGRFILDRQNADGGFGTYERRRGARFLERLNPSEMFGQCMTELSYIECTCSAVIALCRLRAQEPGCLPDRIEQAIARACAFLRGRQRTDGSYPGFWGVNFTYAMYFVVAALRTAGVPANDPTLARARSWLISKQKPDGSWGEHYSGCLNGQYVEHQQGQPVMTSWATLALLELMDCNAEPVRRAIAWLCRKQAPDGSWPEGAVNGVFFGSAMLIYRLYPAYFPAWAINCYLAVASHAACR